MPILGGDRDPMAAIGRQLERELRGVSVAESDFDAANRHRIDKIDLVCPRPLAAGADPNTKGKMGYTPLHSAAFRGRTENARALLEAGASVEAISDSGQPPLHVASSHGIIALLIEHGADVKARTPEGVTPLHYASRWPSDPRVIDLLVRHGARVDAVTDNGSQPLHEAAYMGKACGTAALIRHGADVHAEWNGRTPLEWAVRRESPDEMLLLLVESGATIDLAFRYSGDETEGDRTLLHAAAEGGATRFARILLDKGADVNARDTDGRTPLYLAIQADRVDMVRILLEAGAAVNGRGTRAGGVERLLSRRGR